MSVNINDIRDPYWSLSTLQPGEVVQGDIDIAQSVAIILRTRKGSDPLRPFFGAGLSDFIDQPVNIAAPAIVNEIVIGLGKWEPRIRVTSVTYQVRVSHVIFTIQWERLDTSGGGNQSATLVSVSNFSEYSFSFGDFNFDFSNDFDNG